MDMEDESSPNVGSPESPCFSKASTNATSNSNKEQDRFLPIANVGRIMKKVLPVNGKISKDAKETVQECVSEFISFVTGEASEKCQREKRKTINGDDIIWAVTILGFEDYVVPLKAYLNKYREIEGEKLNIPNKQHHQQQRMQLHQVHQEENSNNNTNNGINYSCSDGVYSSYMGSVSDHHHQPFSLAFSPNSIQKQLQQQQQQHDQVDSLGQW